MNIVWFAWKDINHPAAGGAENISWQIMRRLAAEGHQVRLITARYNSSSREETIHGVEIFRTGNRLSVYLGAMLLFRRQMSRWPDLIIDEMNTIPFAAGFYSRKKRVLLAYQLARQVWFYQALFPISYIGYAIEPFYLFALSRRYKKVLTESESSRQDFARYGFHAENTSVFRVGIDLKPIEALDKKKSLDNILVLGAIRPMKRTLDAVKGFELACDQNPSLQLKLAGNSNGRYASRVLKYISESRHANAIQVLGKVSEGQRLELMRQASLILVTSIKEGWGLIVTEANSQGTPAIAYNADGLRDSVKDGETGLLVKSGDTSALGRAVNRLLSDKDGYQTMRNKAWVNSRQYTFKNCYDDFTAAADIDTNEH
jgi:glycosyltransferase involved in cell wall biosynthesis